MKLRSFILALVASLSLCLLSACSTTSTTSIDDVAGDLKIVAQEATAYVLADKPDDRVKFERAVAGLKSLEASGTVNAESIIDALQLAGIDALDNRDARLAIAGGKLVFRNYVRRSSTVIDQNFLPVAKAIREGIEASL
jgi:hypothetical protein